jgi:hypothetical protein
MTIQFLSDNKTLMKKSSFKFFYANDRASGGDEEDCRIKSSLVRRSRVDF